MLPPLHPHHVIWQNFSGLYRAFYRLTQGGGETNGSYELFAKHFKDRIACIHQDLDLAVIADESQGGSRTQSSPIILDEFQLIRLEDVNKLLGSVKATTCALDPCPSISTLSSVLKSITHYQRTCLYESHGKPEQGDTNNSLNL